METIYEKSVREKAEKVAAILLVLDEHPRTTTEINELLGTAYTPLQISAFLREVEGITRYTPQESGKCWVAYSYVAPPKTESARQAAKRAQLCHIEREIDRLIALIYEWGGTIELSRDARYISRGTKILPSHRVGKKINSLRFLTD